MSDCEQPRMMASTLAANLSRMLPASGREREQKNRLFASRRRYDCKRLHLDAVKAHGRARLGGNGHLLDLFTTNAFEALLI